MGDFKQALRSFASTFYSFVNMSVNEPLWDALTIASESCAESLVKSFNPFPGDLAPGDSLARSTPIHSFRRTALTMMSSAGIPLRHIQEISGHNDLGTLQRYLEVTPEQRRKAVAAIGF